MEHVEYPIIGRRELVDFPAMGIEGVEAKVDTGAYTSSIHCASILIDGDKVTCVFLDPDHEQYTGESFTFPIQKKVKVRSSNGMEEKRVVILTEMQLLGVKHPIRLTLTDRSNMNYPVLIGRRFLSKKFIVDVNRKNQTAS